MRNAKRIVARSAAIVAVLLCGGLALQTRAAIDGITGTNFSFTAKSDFISTPDGNSLTIWGFADTTVDPTARAQYPGPTLIVNQGDTITVTLANRLDEPVSIVFPGQANVTASGDLAGLITAEAAPFDGVTPGAATYTFTAANPGTYMYYSGTRPELQVEMGLVGAIIVRPTLGANYAYNHADTRFDREYLFLLSEMDPTIHDLVEFGQIGQIDNTTYWPVYWFINGRNAPDTMGAAFAPWLPTQPYNCLPRMHPGEKTLMRVIGAGRDLHPYHHHGNHSRIIARDGRLLESSAGAGPDLSYEVFTIQSVPGETVDAIYQWTGKGLGWDVYGDPATIPHACSDLVNNDSGAAGPDGYDDVTWEWCADHGKPIPVVLPENQNVTFGGFWSGSPFLGQLAPLPPGQGGLNENGGFYHMWHSHTEKEMVNFDLFPGGMMTMAVIEPPGAPIM